MSLAKKTVTGVFLLVSMSGNFSFPSAAESTNLKAVGAAHKAPLDNIIYQLADYKKFRSQASELDAIASIACKKNKEIKDEYGVLYKYVCDPQTGLSDIRIDSRGAGANSYTMSMTVHFSYEKFSAMKKIVAERLGRTSRNFKDMSTWQYTSDAKLNEFGNPIIYVARSPETHSASFVIALEQGP